MDIFNIGSRFDSASFFSTLAKIIKRLERPGRFLTDVDMELLGRIWPLRYVAFIATPLTSRLYQPEPCTALPAEYTRMIRMCKGADGENNVALSVAELIVVVIHHGNHYSALVLDMIQRCAYHFDSATECGHPERAAAICANLCRFGILDDSTPRSTIYFEQPSTECGLYVLRAGLMLDRYESHHAASRLSRHQLLQDVLECAAQDSFDGREIATFREQVATRVSSIMILLYNARPEATEPESLEQQGVLGPMCNRTALRRLCMGEPPIREQVFAALSLMVPRGLSLTVHTMPVGMTIVGVDAQQAIRGHALCLFNFTSTQDVSIVRHTVLMAMQDPGHPPLLFTPHGMLSPELRSTINALISMFSATQVELRMDGFSRPDSAACLPLLILAWWANLNVGLAPDKLPELLAETARLVAISDIRRPEACIDWMFRQMLAVVLDDGCQRMEMLFTSIRERTGKIEAEEDALELIHRMLTTGPLIVAASITQDCMRKEMVVEKLDEVAVLVDATIRFACENAPRCWNQAHSLDELRRMYYHFVDPRANGIELMRRVKNTVQNARGLATLCDDVSSAQSLIAQLFDVLWTGWPVMLVAPLGIEDDNPWISIKPTDNEYGDALRDMLMQPVGSPVQIHLCPVMLFNADLITAQPLSMYELDEMRIRFELSHDYKDVPLASIHLKLDAIGGQSSPISASKEDWFFCPQFTRQQIEIPRFNTEYRTLVPIALRNREHVRDADAMQVNSVSAESSLIHVDSEPAFAVAKTGERSWG